MKTLKYTLIWSILFLTASSIDFNSDQTVTIQTADSKKTHTIKLKHIKHSNTLAHLLEENIPTTPIIVSNVADGILEKYIAPALQAIEEKTTSDFISKTLSDLDAQRYLNIINAANLLDISFLFEASIEKFYNQFLTTNTIEALPSDTIKLMPGPVQKHIIKKHMELETYWGPSRTLHEHVAAVYSVCFVPTDGGYILASGCHDGTIKLWNVSDGSCIRTIQAHDSFVRSVCSYRDKNGSYIASASRDIRLWNSTTGALINTLELDNVGCRIDSVYWSSDGTMIASGSTDKTIRVWNFATKKTKDLIGHNGNVYSVDCNNDTSNPLLASGSGDNTVKIWDIISGNCIKTLKGHTDWVKSVCFSSDGKQLASGSEDGSIRLWNVTTGECANIFHGHTSGIRSVWFNNDKNNLMLISGSSDKTIKLWGIATNRCLQTLEGHTDPLSSVCCSPDGSLIASSSLDHTIRIWRKAQADSLAQAQDITYIEQAWLIKKILQQPQGKKYIIDFSKKSGTVFKALSNTDQLFVAHKCAFYKDYYRSWHYYFAALKNNIAQRNWRQYLINLKNTIQRYWWQKQPETEKHHRS